MRLPTPWAPPDQAVLMDKFDHLGAAAAFEIEDWGPQESTNSRPRRRHPRRKRHSVRVWAIVARRKHKVQVAEHRLLDLAGITGCRRPGANDYIKKSFS